MGPDSSSGRGARKRICIATPDVVGPVKCGGIGTAYHHLARMLAGWGHEVTIAYVNGNAGDAERMAAARALYAGFGVAFEPIVPQPAGRTVLAQAPAPTWTLFDWLRRRTTPFDVVHVSDWHGLGYGPLLARSLGTAFAATHFVVHGHGPTLWNVEGNRQLVAAEEELAWVFMERRSVELADTVVCGSAHLLGWMRDAGYALPARAFVWPNPFPAPDPGPEAAAARAARDGARLEEVVFFGRLEPRKGLLLFVAAVDRLVRRGQAPGRVTFLGAQARRFDGPGHVARAARAWPMAVEIVTRFDAAEAVAHLSRPGRLAVLPSLQENASLAVTECLAAGISFVATATGGTPELVASEDRPRALVPPASGPLADRLAELAGAPLRPVRPRWAFDRACDGWRRWHAQAAPFAASGERFAARARATGEQTPPVTVCLVHRERPDLLQASADGVLAQDYPADALDVVLVDAAAPADAGNASGAAGAAAAAVETAFTARGWRVVRPERRGPGSLSNAALSNAAARNAAAAAARGEWLLFLDAGDVLLPDAVSRLVRAARFAGADCVPATGIRGAAGGDRQAERRGPPVRFIGAARAWHRVRPVAGGACLLVTRVAFAAAGGCTETDADAPGDPSFFDRLLRSGRRIEPLPDPVFRCRAGPDSPRRAAGAPPATAADFAGAPDEERAYASYAAACIQARQDAPPAARGEAAGARPALALARRRTRFGAGRIEVGALIPPAWSASRRGAPAAFELRRNGRIVAAARAAAEEAGGLLRFPPRWRLPALRDACYSLHDAATGAGLAAVVAPSFRQTRRIAGAVERRPGPEVRGWLLDPGRPERVRRVAIHLDGRLRAVVAAGARRDDVARWKGTGGRHGFVWRLPAAAAAEDGTRVDVFDADTGRPLRGSPLRVNSPWRRPGVAPRRAARPSDKA